MPDAARSAFALDGAASRAMTELFHGMDGRAVRPCTPADVTHRHLRMLDVRPGDHVLDIGLGSGLSAALLSRLAGPGGRVTAVEIDPGLAARAEALCAAHGHRVEVVVGDGLFGHPPRAPYDRILAGVTPPAVPDDWLRQLKPYGVLLCGVRTCGLPGGYAVARITADGRHRPHRVAVHLGGYMPMTAPEIEENVTRAGDPGRTQRSLTLLGSHEPRTAASLLAALTGAVHVEAAPFHSSDWFHLRNWLIATEPDGLLEATLDRGDGIGVGCLSRDGTPHAALVTGIHLIADRAGSPALSALTALVGRWRESGAPRTDELHAELRPDGDRWHLRISAAA